MPWVKVAPYLVILALVGAVGERHFQLRLSNAALKAARVEIVEKDGVIKGLRETTLTAETISGLAAEACKSTARTVVIHRQEAETIREAPPATGGPAAAYRRLLCLRTEAAGLPACKAAR